MQVVRENSLLWACRVIRVINILMLINELLINQLVVKLFSCDNRDVLHLKFNLV